MKPDRARGPCPLQQLDTFQEYPMNQDHNGVRSDAPTPGAGDAAAVLTAGHREAQALFERYQALVEAGAGAAERHALAETLCVVLTAHITAAEELLSPVLAGAPDAAPGHLRARHLIADLMAMAPADPGFDAAVQALHHEVDGSVQEAERDLLPRLGRSGLDLHGLGARLSERKRELVAEMEALEA
jgi:hypothetical protein